MRNHIAFKFIAVLLCAVSLLGIVGSAAGLFVLTETDLNSKTVNQVIDVQIQQNGQSFANAAALRYASQALGNCPEEVLENHFGTNWFYDIYEADKLSYTLQDAEGNAVYSYGTPLENATAYTFPVSGQYLHMVSKETETEQNIRLQTEAASYSANLIIGENYEVKDALPLEGSLISYAAFYDPLGTVIYEVYDKETGSGFLYYGQNGRVTFSGFASEYRQNLIDSTIAGVSFLNLNGHIVYQASSVEGVGTVSFNTLGQMVFTAADPATGMEPVTLVETEPATEPVAEAEPVTVSEPEPPAPTLPSEVLPVYYAAFYSDSSEEKIYRVRGEESIGFLSLDSEGNTVYRGFREEEDPLPVTTAITGAYFCDADDTVVFEAYSDDGVGILSYTENGQLIFTTAEPAVTDADETTAQATEEASSEEEPETAEATAATESEEVEPAAETTAVTEAPTVPVEAVVPTEPVTINGKSLDEYQIEVDSYFDPQLNEQIFVSYVYTPMPEYTVTLYLAPDALRSEIGYTLLQLIQNFAAYLLPALGICLLVFAVSIVYLCCSAGRKPGSTEVHAGGLNCLPLDFYAALVFAGITGTILIGVEAAYYRLEENFIFSCGLAVAMAFLACLILVAFFFAFVAQIKTPGGYWWRNSLITRSILLFMRFGVWLEKFLALKVFPALKQLCKTLWKFLRKTAVDLFHLWQKFADWAKHLLRRMFNWLGCNLHRFFSLLPITWQWLVIGFAMFLLMAIVFATNGEEVLVVLCLGACVAIIVYGAHCFGILSESAKRMSKGDLDTKVDDRLLLGCFKDFAGDLNDLADVAVIAAQKQLKSERMKTELITNVSHDIKTPLTSIINYVDLLLKPHSEEDQAVYLEVLERQSQRLKKLIEDLMEMSKASTGNMAVEITTVDAVESVNQALGEFADKLSAARLTPMFRHTEERISMMADGKLVWRVMSNVLSNAVKYAMPGTRLYIDLMELEGKVVISLKNISREELNMDADELMERFVRGDDSRNTEGSGLGLNITKSLMELQKGQLQLLVDGDLFKVTLIFPGA